LPLNFLASNPALAVGITQDMEPASPPCSSELQIGSQAVQQDPKIVLNYAESQWQRPRTLVASCPPFRFATVKCWMPMNDFCSGLRQDEFSTYGVSRSHAALSRCRTATAAADWSSLNPQPAPKMLVVRRRDHSPEHDAYVRGPIQERTVLLRRSLSRMSSKF